MKYLPILLLGATATLSNASLFGNEASGFLAQDSTQLPPPLGFSLENFGDQQTPQVTGTQPSDFSITSSDESDSHGPHGGFHHGGPQGFGSDESDRPQQFGSDESDGLQFGRRGGHHGGPRGFGSDESDRPQGFGSDESDGPHFGGRGGHHGSPRGFGSDESDRPQGFGSDESDGPQFGGRGGHHGGPQQGGDFQGFNGGDDTAFIEENNSHHGHHGGPHGHHGHGHGPHHNSEEGFGDKRFW